MARQASSKSDSGSSSAGIIGFEADSCSLDVHHSNFDMSPAGPKISHDSTQVSVCPWFLGKSVAAGKSRAAAELELALAA